MPSPKPKPTNLKLLEGNPGQRPINKHEPKPDPSMPKPPDWLGEKELKLWNELAPELNEIGVLTRIDAGQFAFYCFITAQASDLAVYIRENGTVDSRTRKRRPEAISFENSVKQSKAMAAEFGLTPSSRTGLSTVDGKDDDWSKFE
jgi:P27 family predicted phage terminase small subunit